ncbi:MAG: hypothetical protein H6R19_660 [Proteobacteria bacterium]|nr:hypothetical protein [Pseudomonadota bacterium]
MPKPFPSRLQALRLLPLLLLPGLLHAAAPKADEDMARIVVAQHDTLIDLGKKLLARPANWPRLQKLNRIADPLRLQPGSTLLIPAALLKAEPLQARLESVSGSVQGSTGVLAAGALLAADDSLTTGANSYAVVVLPDDSRYVVQPDSQIRVEQLQRLRGTNGQQSRVEIRQGRLENSVQPQRGPAARYEIRTPTALIGVRGTHFRAGYDGSTARVEVTEGVVASNRDTRLNAGQGAVVDAAGTRTASLLAAPVTTGIPALFERPLIRLPLPETAGAAAHRVIVAGSAGFNLPLAEVLATGREARIAGLPDGDYRVRLRAVSAEGLEGQDADAAFRLKARPEPPFASQPLPGGKVQGERVDFQWTEQPEAARYRIQIAGADGFARPLAQAEDLTGTRFSTSLPPGAYQWRVASTRADGDRGPWSDAVPFTLKPLQGPPEPPAVGDDSVAFAWPAEPGQRFEFVMARDLAFAQIVQTLEPGEPKLVLPKPAAGEYFVRVRATDPDGFVGQWSSPQRFVVEASRPWWLIGVLPLLLLIH